jgi:hypothetical protein
MVGFPKAGGGQKITVRFAAVAGGGERWTRSVGGREFSSEQRPARATAPLLRERFGIVAVDTALVADATCLKYVVCHWSLLGIPLPLWLGPQSSAREYTEEGRFRFDVEIRHVLTGLIVRYRGWLVEDAC